MTTYRPGAMLAANSAGNTLMAAVETCGMASKGVTGGGSDGAEEVGRGEALVAKSRRTLATQLAAVAGSPLLPDAVRPAIDSPALSPTASPSWSHSSIRLSGWAARAASKALASPLLRVPPPPWRRAEDACAATGRADARGATSMGAHGPAEARLDEAAQVRQRWLGESCTVG